MNKAELKKLFLIINNCYQNFQIDEVKTEIWLNVLSNISFDEAAANVREHIKTSSFPPTIANIIQADRPIHHEQLKAETATRFADMDSWEQKAIDCPVHLAPRFLKSGVSD